MTIHSPSPKTADGAGRRLRVAVFIEHDIIYRHFVQSRVFSDLAHRHAVTFVFPERAPGNKRLTIVPDPSEVGAPFEYVRIDPVRLTFWRRLFQVSQLRWRRGRDWAHLRKVMRYLVGPRASKLYAVLALPGIFRLYEAWTMRQISRRATMLDPLLDRLAPDVIVHPTVLDGYFVNDLIMLGRARGIPTVAIMNSWDNPSTKRAVVGQPDRLLVWGPQTRDLAIRYAGMAPERVICFGAAQFDIYRREPRVTREEFCRRHAIDPAKPILLYAGSSKGSDEFAHLQMIEEAIDRGTLAQIAVVYRPHPWGRGGYKGERLLDQPWRHVRIESSMRTYLEEIRAGRKAIHLADYADTHDVLACVDAVVSPLSTILLEAALHGKPMLCFLPDEKEGSSLALQAKHAHFEAMYENPIFLKAHGDLSLVGKLSELMGLVGDPGFVTALQQTNEFFVAPYAEPYGSRLRDFLEQFAASQRIGLDRPTLA